jgi:tetratricopeptide (TPR) repeat protein
MKLHSLFAALQGLCFALLASVACAQADQEQLGVVSFAVSCAESQHAAFSRGVALLHDFWYEEAAPQFTAISKADPSCAMAHWGIAMSGFRQIWDRPDEAGMAEGWREMQRALALPAKTARERGYIAALSGFFRPGKPGYETRINAYAAAMGDLYKQYPDDVDAGAFYALALLAAASPDDLSLDAQHKAMAVLTPLWRKYPDHPGLVHYIIHACDTPSLAPDGLAAARHYGGIAASGPHAVHMPGHIFARLGMWPEDIQSNLASVAASQAAEARHESGWMDQFHSDDFLLYAYLQSGQDARARALVNDATQVISHYETMAGGHPEHYMTGMFPYYRMKFQVFLALEMRDWSSASKLTAIPSAPPETQMQIYWARAIAHGHLHQADGARADLAGYDRVITALRKTRHAYYADSTDAKIVRGEILAWSAFAQGHASDAVTHMRESADLQDKVGQGEVDIPAREMLGDILLEQGQAKPALAEYRRALELSPNRFNGLFNAGRAAEESGDRSQAVRYYSALLKSTNNGSETQRPEIAHARQSLLAAAGT